MHAVRGRFALQPDIANGSSVDDNSALNPVEETSMATVVVGGNTYLFATEFGANGVSVLAVSRDGSLANVAHIAADATVRLIAPSRPLTLLDNGTYLLIHIMDYIVQNAIANRSLEMARPREFDPEVALDRAMEMFWSKGYEAASLDDLCEATGLSRSSFYATFGSKRALLMKSIDRYVEQRNPRIVEALARPGPIRDAFAALAQRFIDQIVDGPGRRGCFLGNCAAELPRSDRAALAHVKRGLDATEAAFRDALKRAKERGELAAGADVDALAQFLVVGFQGLRLVGKAYPDRTLLENSVKTMLHCLD